MKRTAIDIGDRVADAGMVGPLLLDVPRLLDTRLLVTGNSGAGKSRLFRVIAERAFGLAQVVVIDPEGEFPTLRERHDYLLVGPGGEVRAEPRSAGLLARRLLELRTSAVIDLSELRLHERRAHVRLFLEELVEHSRSQGMLVMIDEAHLFCPEKDQDAESGPAVIDLMSRGRKRGLAGCLASQRLSKVNKDAAAEAKNVVIGGITVDVDLRRACDLLGLSKSDWSMLRDLPSGEFLTFGPALEDVRGVVRFEAAKPLTTHPTPGTRQKVAAIATPDAIRKLVAELADLPQKAEEEIRDLAAAKARIRDLERELKAGPKPAAPKAGKPVEVVSAAALKRIEAALARMEKEGERLEAARVHLDGAIGRVGTERDRLAQAQQVVVAEAAGARKALAGARNTAEVAAALAAGKPVPFLQRAQADPAVLRAPVAARASRPPRGARGAGPDVPGLSAPEKRILDELAELEALELTPCDRVLLAFMCGYQNHKSGGFSEPLGRMVQAGHVLVPAPGRVDLSESGRAIGLPRGVTTTPAELQERILGRLDPPAAKILRAVIRHYPNAVLRIDLASECNYENHKSGGFSEPLGWLTKRGIVLVPAPGQVKASPLLFLEHTRR